MNVLTLLPIAVPLMAAGISVVLLERLAYQRIIALTASLATLVAAVMLLIGVHDGGATAGRVLLLDSDVGDGTALLLPPDEVIDDRLPRRKGNRDAALLPHSKGQDDKLDIGVVEVFAFPQLVAP